MKKIKFIIPLISLLVFTNCGESFLDTKNLYEKLDVDYYSNATDINEALMAAYSCLPTDKGVYDPIFMSNLLSDECFAGGGINDVSFYDMDAFTQTGQDRYIGLWAAYYRGIFRVNMIIKRFDQAVFDNENDKNQAHGEAYFLRAYFYFVLSQFFGNVPLITDPAPVNLPKASADVLFAQIALDLKTAIELMPAISYQKLPTSRLGYANKWAAEALMARVFLFYTGYYEKDNIQLTDGSIITRNGVIQWVDDCVANSGYGLITDFRNLWPYAYANKDYPYAANNNLEWVGDEGANIENVFCIKFSVFSNWTEPNKISYSNQLVLFMGMRGQEGLIPFGTGWGGGTVNPQIIDSFEPNDPRMKGSIAYVNDPEEGNVSTDYIWGVWECMHETGYWQKKYTPIQIPTDKGLKSIFYVMYPGSPDNMQLWNMQDEYLIRFADVLLMGAELGSSHAQEYLDRVRSRVGLPSVPVTLENIKRERRHELAFEGLRYFDLLRWHDVEEAFGKVKAIPVKNVGVDDIYNSSYRPETGGFVPIPESQILLSDGVLKQNTGW